MPLLPPHSVLCCPGGNGNWLHCVSEASGGSCCRHPQEVPVLTLWLHCYFPLQQSHVPWGVKYEANEVTRAPGMICSGCKTYQLHLWELSWFIPVEGLAFISVGTVVVWYYSEATHFIFFSQWGFECPLLAVWVWNFWCFLIKLFSPFFKKNSQIITWALQHKITSLWESINLLRWANYFSLSVGPGLKSNLSFKQNEFHGISAPLSNEWEFKSGTQPTVIQVLSKTE